MPDNTSNFIKIDCIDNSPIPDSAIYNCRTIYNKYGKLKVYDKLNEEMYKSEYHEGLFYTDKIENRDGSYYYVDKTENKVFHVSADGLKKDPIGKEVIGTVLSIASFNRSIVIRTKDDGIVKDWVKISSGEYIVETEEMKKKSSVTKQDLRYLNLYRRAYLATRTFYYGLPVTDSFLTKPKKVYLGDKDPNDYCAYCGGKRSNIVWKGNCATPPFDPKLGWAYFDTTKNQYFVWDGFSWKVKHEEDIADKKLHLNLSAPKYKQECVVEKEFTISQEEYDKSKDDYMRLIMPPEAYGMYSFEEFVEVKNKEEFKDIVNEISKYEDNEKAYELYKKSYTNSSNDRYNAGYLQRDYNYKIYLDGELLEEGADYDFSDNINEKAEFDVLIYKSRGLIIPGTTQKIKYESSSKTRYKMCTNPNCYVNAAGLNYAKWQWINDDASIPMLDQVHAGYVPKAGFSLDDYSTETFNYKGSILNLKQRGGGFGFPRSYRFDFEYRFVNREADEKDEPHYFDLYKKILYNTFKRVIYTVMLNHFNVLRYEEIETALNVIYDLPDEYKCKLVKLTDDFIDIQTRLYEAEEKGDKKAIEAIMDPETGDNKLITDRLIEVHDELMLPVEYMCIVAILISYPRHMIILSDSKGGISSKLTVNNSLYSTMDSSNISITHYNGAPITHSVSIEGIIKTVIDRNKEDTESDDLYLYENYYLVSDDDFHMSLYSFLSSRWLEHSESSIFDLPFDTTDNKIVKMKNVKYKDLNCVAIITKKELALFDFDNNEWVMINGKATMTSQEIFGNDYDLFVDFDYRKYQTTIDVPNGKDKIPTVTTFNYFAFISDKLFRVYDIENNELIECMNYDADPIMPIDIDDKMNTNGIDFYVDTDDTKHLADLNKVFINIPSSALDDKNKIRNLIYFTLIDSRGNIQIIKTDGIVKAKVFLSIKFVDKISKVINIFDTEETNIFIVYENMRILSLTSFMYKINILQQPEKINNKTSIIDSKTYITTNGKDIRIMPITESNPLIEQADPPQPIQIINLQEDLLLPLEYNEINGIKYERDSTFYIDIKKYGILKMKLVRNTDITDLNKQMFLLKDIEEVVLEKILVSNRFKYNDGYYLSYITDRDNSASVYAFYEANIDPVGLGMFKSTSKLINKGSEVTTYDEVFVKNSNIKMWTRSVYELGVYKQRELFNSQK